MAESIVQRYSKETTLIHPIYVLCECQKYNTKSCQTVSFAVNVSQTSITDNQVLSQMDYTQVTKCNGK